MYVGITQSDDALRAVVRAHETEQQVRCSLIGYGNVAVDARLRLRVQADIFDVTAFLSEKTRQQHKSDHEAQYLNRSWFSHSQGSIAILATDKSQTHPVRSRLHRSPLSVQATSWKRSSRARSCVLSAASLISAVGQHILRGNVLCESLGNQSVCDAGSYDVLSSGLGRYQPRKRRKEQNTKLLYKTQKITMTMNPLLGDYLCLLR